MPSETTPLKGDGGGLADKLTKDQIRASVAAIGGSESLGTFKVQQQPDIAGLSKSYSIAADGSPADITPKDLGVQELYEQIPFTAVFGLQKKERAVSEAFANFVADAAGAGAPSLEEATKRKSMASMAVLDELEFEAAVVTPALMWAASLAMLCQFLVGYNTSVLNAPEPVMFPGHSTGSWSFAVASFAISAPFGAMFAGRAVESRGRRGALLIDIWVFLIGGLIQTFSTNMAVLIVSRLVIGFASGCSSVLVPIYLGEIAPPTLRGTFGTLVSFAMVIGILVADLVAFPLATEDGWRIMVSITSITAVVQLVFSRFLLESPRWLLAKDPNSMKARSIIKSLRGLRTPQEVETEVGHFLIGGDVQKQEETSQSAILKEICDDPKMRHMFVACIVLQVAQQFCGINAVFFYSTSFFEGVIDNPQIGTTIVGVVNVLATYAALLLMDRCARKTLLLWSSGGMFLSCVVIVLALLGVFSNIYALLAVNVYVTFFEIGMGPIPWLICPEYFEGKYVSVVMSVATQVNYSCSFIVGLTFPYFVKYLGAYSFGPFGVVLLGTFLFALCGLPDTTEPESVEEITQEIVRTKSEALVYEANDENAGALDEEWRKAMEQLIEEEGGGPADMEALLV